MNFRIVGAWARRSGNRSQVNVENQGRVDADDLVFTDRGYRDVFVPDKSMGHEDSPAREIFRARPQHRVVRDVQIGAPAIDAADEAFDLDIRDGGRGGVAPSRYFNSTDIGLPSIAKRPKSHRFQVVRVILGNGKSIRLWGGHGWRQVGRLAMGAPMVAA